VIETLNHEGKTYTMTHCTMFDFKSLYPFCFGSIDFPFSPYTDHVMYMLGSVKYIPSTNEQKMEVINGRKELFIVSIKGHIPEEKFNIRTPGAVSDSATVLNFPLVYMNLEITTDRETIDETMYEYMRNNGIPTGRKETKLTQLLNTNCKYIVITSYYLWFLLDYCYFEIDDVQEMYVFIGNTAFNGFVRDFMDKKTTAVAEQEKLFYKLIMNS
jgi:hypothetical protein